jgi:hypothetical protein
MEASQRNEGLYRAKESLEEAKRQFLMDLNKKDPLWREKMHVRKIEEIRRMELYQQQLAKELVERQKQLEAERLLNDTVIRMKNSINDQLEHMNEIERMHKNMELEQSIN